MKKALGCLGVCLTLAACDSFKREVTDRIDDHEPSTWTSQGDCEALLAQRPPVTNPRIGTWNVRFFPDSQENQAITDENATDVPWLACAIVSLDVDVLAVQEFKMTPRSVQKQQELIGRLNELTGGDWRIELASCEPLEVQHPGFLYDASRVTGSRFREIPILNPDPVCSNAASPGFGAYFEMEGGPNFHFIAVHLMAGDVQDAMNGRADAVAHMPEAIEEAYALVPDQDVIIAGDFNTGGCADCVPPLSGVDEVGRLGDTMNSMGVPLLLIGASETCTFQSDDDPNSLLDHFVVAKSMAEVPPGSVAHVDGICKELQCGRLRNWLEGARDRLSDHCPVLLNLATQDDDGSAI
ncbi:MAG TPA: endonuclease/exonuclease/phosphatase family protein [Polyangiaceae bacterium]|nr:endonuclease/exonuclease/phosphatase family protein [Polyangiaceae bacterium]